MRAFGLGLLFVGACTGSASVEPRVLAIQAEATPTRYMAPIGCLRRSITRPNPVVSPAAVISASAVVSAIGVATPVDPVV